jgi:hypothetical protein
LLGWVGQLGPFRRQGPALFAFLLAFWKWLLAGTKPLRESEWLEDRSYRSVNHIFDSDAKWQIQRPHAEAFEGLHWRLPAEGDRDEQ